MQEISVKTIEQAVYTMCREANIYLPFDVYEKIKDASNFDEQNKFILQNAQIAAKSERPLCQDTGQVIVFLNIGQEVHFIGGNLYESINSAVAKCYKENYFRKSVVKDALKNRENTDTNTPCVIHTEITSGDEVEIKIIIKGGGSENVTGAKLLQPSLNKNEIDKEILDIVASAGKNACPPLFIGAGFGQTLDQAVLLSKKAIIDGNEDNELVDLLNENIKIGLNIPVLSVKTMSAPTHIASLPMGVTILCHSNRVNSCKIKNGEIFYTTKLQKKFSNFNDRQFDGRNQIVSQIVGTDILTVKQNEKILFSGKIFTARDAAHKKLVQMIKNNEKLPIDLNNAIIFYAGPCPNKNNEVSGPIGPTTAKRMDNFAIDLYKNGVITTIAKGTRSAELMNYLEKSGKKYFELQGGIASLLSQCVKASKIVAFEELGAEAIYELEVENMPLTCVI